MKNNYNSQNSKKNEKFIRTNYNIRSKYCRVIENGKTPTIMQTDKAIEYAEKLGLDLVEIGFDKANNCSNCKICDYSKFLYEQKKKEKEAKKQARANKIDIKSVQFSLTTDVADKERMISHAKEFLNEGDKVKLVLRFRNKREIANQDLAKNTMREILTAFEGLAELDSALTVNGKEFSCIIRKKK
jgi:translation initiation factor IF-3